ncbi:DUF3515 domain-containing protein [Auraticoccus monumenti]|uniref:DUF3515 domain-containing protein n=1 Tax=Auraticoccus monumenti TaxID=675864 RepID=UPI0022B25D87|nr:DUF3515 domain-containing protein [Auraticoccus monumenti]
MAGALALTACSAEVALEPPTPDPASAAVCAELVPALPATLAGQPAREVTGPRELVAAWGTPPITVRCGVPQPAALEPTSQCFEVQGVGWFAEPVPEGYLFTTIGRTAFVEVGVPSRYAPEADVLVELAPAVSAHDPVQRPCV